MNPAPPHNMAAEMAVLGALLSDNAALSRIEGALTPHDFYHPSNAVIFETIVRLAGEGRVADGVTLKEHFEKNQTLTSIGGGKYLADLLASAAFGPEIADYARLIRELSGRRQIMTAAHSIIREAEVADGIGGKPLEELAAIAQAAIDRATSVWRRPAFFQTNLEAPASIARALVRANGGGMSTGLEKLDRMIGGLYPEDLVVIAARPSMGKTQLACEIATLVACQDVPEGEAGGSPSPVLWRTPDAPLKRVVVFFSLEMNRDAISQRMLSAELWRGQGVSLPYRDMRNGWVHKEHLTTIACAAERLPFIEGDDCSNVTIAYLRERLTALKKARGRIDLCVIDYLQLMDAQKSRNETLTEAIGRMTRGLKLLAREFCCCVVLLSQLSRKAEEREDKRPQLADLRDSGSIEQDADVVLLVYREHYYLAKQAAPKKRADKDEWDLRLADAEPVFDVIAAKQRFGPVGDVRLYWNPASGFISDDRERVS